MSAVPICAGCGQPLRLQRFGVRLTPFKCDIVDAIKAAGDLGISTEELMRELYPDAPVPSKYTIKAHVWQINELLSETRYSIVSDRRRWFLRKT